MFLSALSYYPQVLDVEKYLYINNIITNHQIKLPLAYYKVLNIIVERLDVNQYLSLLESTILQHFDGRWTEIRSFNIERTYF
jgi:hypothetical protein